MAFYLEKWLILGWISQENHSCKLLSFYFPPPGVTVHKTSQDSAEKDKLKFNPVEKVTTPCLWWAKFVRGSYCMNLKSLFLFHLSLLIREKRKKKKNNQREGNSHLENLLSNLWSFFLFSMEELLFFQGTEETIGEEESLMSSHRLKQSWNIFMMGQ